MADINVEIIDETIQLQIMETPINISANVPGVSKFTQLEDVPQSFEAGKFLKAEADRLVYAVPSGSGDMLMSVYDANGNDIVDYAEGARVLSDFPANSKQGDIVVVNNKVYINL